jgi:glycine oxidase
MPAQGVTQRAIPAAGTGGGMGGTSDVVVVGAGLIGLAVAWRAGQHGMTVTIVDPAPGLGACRAAAGMLAPVTELHYEGRDLLTLSLDSAARYPAFIAELTQAAGASAAGVGYQRCGTLAVAWDAADLAGLRDLHAFQASCGVASELLSARDLRAMEPALAADLPGGLWAPDDHQVDPRLLHAALLTVVTRTGATRTGATMLPGRVTGLRPGGGVRTDSGESLAAGTVVLAAGAWSGALVDVPVRPVKGQTLRLRASPALNHVVRGTVRGSPVYLVPRSDGSLVVGASSEEAGFDMRPRTGAVFDLLRDAQALVPELSEAEFVEVSTGLRPGTPDNAPLIGHGPVPGLILATGHYRNGVLLTPLTADLVLGLLRGESAAVPPVCDPARYLDSHPLDSEHPPGSQHPPGSEHPPGSGLLP